VAAEVVQIPNIAPWINRIRSKLKKVLTRGYIPYDTVTKEREIINIADL
jgi:hypothetical protein